MGSVHPLHCFLEEERDRIRKRQREGIDLALQNGIQFGRPTVYVSEEFKEVYRKWKDRELTAVEAMQEAGVKKISFYKLVKALKEETVKPSYRRNST